MTEDQEKLLYDCLTNVKSQTFHMKRCLDKGNLMDGLKHSTNMLNELRTSKLSPRAYYELYMAVSDELRHLELYFIDEFQKGRRVEDLYELVQYAGNIVPRLYLLITVGVVYIKCAELSQREILCDLVEMCRGVQHPLRGLFLRNYLLQCMRGNLLPDTLVEEGEPKREKGTVEDSVDFILTNFCEMNKLWVRMQHQGHSRDREKNEQERRELRLLVGSNLNRLSSLESVDLDMYKRVILPQLLEQIVSCHDSIAHEYLMDVIIQVFPDSFHLATLETVLQACRLLDSRVSIRTIIIRLIDRLAAYALRSKDGGDENNKILDDVPLFDIFQTGIDRILVSKPEMNAEDVIALQSALLTLTYKIYHEKHQYVDFVLQGTSEALSKLNIKTVQSGTNLAREMLRLLKGLIDGYDTVHILLELEHLHCLMERLDIDTHKQMATHILAHMLDAQQGQLNYLTNQEEVAKLLSLVHVVVRDVSETGEVEVVPNHCTDDLGEIGEEQDLLARVLHLFRPGDLEERFNMLETAGKLLLSGGQHRIRHTLPALTMELLMLSMQLKSHHKDDEGDGDDENSGYVATQGKIFKFVRFILNTLSKVDSETAMKLFLEAALVINYVMTGPVNRKEICEVLETLGYDFVTEAFTILEEEISDSRAQFSLICQLISSIEKMHNFSEENFNPLCVNCGRAAVNLLRKSDQCRAVAMSAQLSWSGRHSGLQHEKRENVDVEEGMEKQEKGVCEGRKVISHLDRSLRLASECVDVTAQVQLLTDIINYNILFALRGVKEVDGERVSKLIRTTKRVVEQLTGSEDDEQTIQYFSNTLQYIAYKKTEPDSFLKDVMDL